MLNVRRRSGRITLRSRSARNAIHTARGKKALCWSTSRRRLHVRQSMNDMRRPSPTVTEGQLVIVQGPRDDGQGGSSRSREPSCGPPTSGTTRSALEDVGPSRRRGVTSYGRRSGRDPAPSGQRWPKRDPRDSRREGPEPPHSAAGGRRRRDWSSVGRNDLPCGSGKKFKKCHGATL